MPRSSRRGEQTSRMAGAALFVLIALAFALGWLLPPTSPMGGYGSRSVGPLENRARLDDPARGAP